MLSELKRFFHFGPIIAISIIKSITIMTLYMNSMWWPPQASIGGFINQTMFLMFSALTMFNFVLASVVGPGYLPLGWKPTEKAAEPFLQYCTFCEGFKAPRSHHCQRCQRCVIKMDHHCPWINNCCGWSNQMYFICFLGFAVIGSLQGAVILVCSLYNALSRDIQLRRYSLHPPVRVGLYTLIFSVFNIGLAVGVVIAVGMLLYLQLRAVYRNRTGIEDWILEKARYRRLRTEEKFVYPYDLGAKKNVQAFLRAGFHPPGDGTSWPVVEGCDQYTLTKEQIEQKKEKQKRATIVRIIKPVSGYWVPVWSQGFKVGCCIPLTDEPRIALSVDDLVKVTRWRKHWLFGEKVSEPAEKDHQKVRIRGWFPRKCAVELICQESEYSTEEEAQETNDQNHLDKPTNGHLKKVN